MDQQAVQATTPPVTAAPATPTIPTAAAPVQGLTASSPNPSPMQPATGSVPPSGPQEKKSSKMGLILVIILIVVLAAGGWFAYSFFMNRSTKTLYQNASKEKEMTPTSAPIPTVGPVRSGDAQLDQQSEDIDSNMMKLDKDVNEVDKGLNDKSVDLSY